MLALLILGELAPYRRGVAVRVHGRGADEPVRAGRVDAVGGGRVADLRGPRNVQGPVRRDVGGREAVRAEHRVRGRKDVDEGRDRDGVAPVDPAVPRLHHPDAVERVDEARTFPHDVHRPVRAHRDARALIVEDVPDDRLGVAERCAAVLREGEDDRGRHIVSRDRVEHEQGPRHVHAVTESALLVGIRGDPFLIVEEGGILGLADERGGSPSEGASVVERALVHGDRVRGRGAVEAQPGVVHASAAVEREGRVAARVVLPSAQARHARDEGAQVSRVARGAAPRGPAIVRVVRARISVAEAAARRALDGARPRPRDVVIRPDHDPAWIVGVHGDRGLVLRGSIGVLVDGHRGRRDGRAVQGAREDEYRCGSRRRGRTRGVAVPLVAVTEIGMSKERPARRNDRAREHGLADAEPGIRRRL